MRILKLLTLIVLLSSMMVFADTQPIADFHYDTEIISGEGEFAGARGTGEINGAAMLIASWTYRGHIFAHGAK